MFLGKTAKFAPWEVFSVEDLLHVDSKLGLGRVIEKVPEKGYTPSRTDCNNTCLDNARSLASSVFLTKFCAGVSSEQNRKIRSGGGCLVLRIFCMLIQSLG